MTSTPIGSSFIVRAAEPAPLAPPASLAAANTGWFKPTVLAFGAICLGQALQVNFGQYHPVAIRWLGIALVATIAAAALPNFGRLVVAAINLGTRKVNGFPSEVLVLGVPDESGNVVLLAPDRDVPLGGRMF